MRTMRHLLVIACLLATASCTAQQPSKSTGALTGFGATRQAWDAAHEAFPGGEKESVYGPDVGRGQPKYGLVMGESRISSYTVFFRGDTSLADAKNQIMRENFPRTPSGRERRRKPAAPSRRW